MNYRKFLAAALSLTLLAGAASCGKTDSSSDNSSEISGGKTEIVSSDMTDNESNSNNSSEDTTEKNSGSPEKTTKTSDKKEETTEKSTASADTPQVSITPSSSSTTPSGGSSSSGNNSSPTSSGGSASSGNTPSSSGGGSSSSSGNSSGGSSPSSGGQSQEAPTEAPEEKEYTAEITLGSSPKITGQNVTASGSVVTITAGGDYRFSGSVSDGQICVNTANEEAVTLILDGVDISNSSGPAIFVYEAKKCTIKVREGTVNNLSDGGKDKVNDGVIFSNDTLRFKGNGTLNITSGNAHGIASDDDIIIENGFYNINSIKSGLFAHDDVTINGGTLDIKGGTNGIKSKGTININGGSTTVSGGTKEEKSSVYSSGSFNYTGGYLFAAGNKVTQPTYSENPYIIVDLGDSVSAGSSVEMILNDTQMSSFVPHNNFRCLMMLAPEISSGSSFYTVINGSSSDTETVGDGQNLFTLK